MAINRYYIILIKFNMCYAIPFSYMHIYLYVDVYIKTVLHGQSE